MRIAQCKQYFITVCLALIAIAWVGFGALAQSPDTFSLALTHVTVIDGTGAAARADQTVLLSADRIMSVGPSATVRIPNGTRTIDGDGRFLIPGLWDAHVHTRYTGIDHLRLFVANGITSIRNMSGPWEHLDEVREWRRDIGVGRRIWASPANSWSGIRRTGDRASDELHDQQHGRSTGRRTARQS